MYKLFQIIGVTGIVASGATVAGALTNTNLPTHQIKSTNLQVKAWPGPHFPGMGPYGTGMNQDYANVESSHDHWGGLVLNFSIKVSDNSFNYIFDHYIKGKGDNPGYAIYDFLTDAYPKGNFTNWLYEYIKGDATKVFGDLANKLGLTSTHTVPIQYDGGYININYADDLSTTHISWKYGWQ